ncbi:hypothetical protein MBLNU230_g4818t1 [Neophaeotheca triangularis]
MVVPPAVGGMNGATAAPVFRPSPSAGPSTATGSTPKLSKSTTTTSAIPVTVTANSTPGAPGALNGPPSGNNHTIPLSARRAEALDLKTVERRQNGNCPSDEPKSHRPFDIPEAPTYRPTWEEFRDPMEYMRKIRPEGEKWGIVKVIPPEGWNPTFAINTEKFHFRTRRQELNSVEGGNRVNNDYLDQLAKFHKQNGHNLNRFPSVDKRPLDLYRLKKTVERKGGFDNVCKSKRWAEVGRDLGYSGKIMSSLSTSLKNSYQKWLLPYEEYLMYAKPGVQQQLEYLNGGPITPSPGPSPAKKSQTNTPLGMMKEHTPAMAASATLNASINGQSTPQLPPVHQEAMQPQPPSTGGFTPVNAGGFTAVNAPGVAPPPPAKVRSVSTAAMADLINDHLSNANKEMQPSIEPPANPSGMPPSNSYLPPSSGVSPPNGLPNLKRQHSESILTPDEIDAMGRRSKRVKRDVPTVAGSNMHHSRISTARFQGTRERGNFKPGEACENCGKPDGPRALLLCDSCDSGFHMSCLDPPMKQRPDYDWHCPRCLVGTGEYGFEEGDVYSLAGFQRKANGFKEQHFANLRGAANPFTPEKRHLTEEDVEKEFWRLVEDLSDTVEVEYGADIHSTTHGSGFPTIELQPRDSYSTDPWNLNIMPLDKDSLFRHIKSDVSGMTVPWLYVGMVFSTFCWHNEDHFAYSANYQHFGDTKTWYGIPGEDSGKFEEAMKEEVPELFETQPDLLFQLVTLAKPEKLRKAGVRVCAIDQHAGQFVVTFPRAYHAGFNHGFNFNEAVNFAPPDWEPFGEEGVKRLKTYRKQPCFPHDEMLLTAAARDHTIRTAKWLAPAMERMRDNELSARQHFLGPPDTEDAPEDSYLGLRYVKQAEIIDPTTEEEEVICAFCKCYCHLSRYRCNKTGKWMCMLHAGGYECCDSLETDRYSGQSGEHTLLYRMTDDQLVKTVGKVVEKGNIPEAWQAKFEAELEDTPTPSLKHMRTLVTEGEKIQYDLPDLPQLRRFVEKCNEWVEEATNYITRKQQNRRKSEKAWRKGKAAAEQEERERELRKVENIRALLARADKLGFDCPEINTLRERADNISDFQRGANSALANIAKHTTAEFEELAERGRDFHVDLPEIENLERLVKRLRWNDLARANRPNPETMRQDQNLNDIKVFVDQGLEIGVPETNPDITFFREHMAQGELWEQKAQELMSVEQVHYQQLDALSRQAATLPVRPDTLARVDAILKKQREVQDKIVSLYVQSKHEDFRQRPMYREVRDVMAQLEELQSKPQGTADLEKEQRRHEDWMRRGKKLFGKANAPLHILHQHMQVVEARNEACFDLGDKPRMPVEPSSRQNTPDPDGEHGGMADGSGSSRDVFCICRKPEAGMMIECELCHEWYHGKCLKIARGKVKEDDKYTCPICDWRVKIPRDAARPKLDDLQAWQDELETLPFQPEEEHTLANICDHAQAFRDFMRPFINPVMTSPEEVGTLRFHLRKIEGADLLLAYETNYLRQELHRWAPVAPEAPPKVEVSGSTRKPRPTKQQKLMAQLGITNPDDLPQQYKIKPHIAKRKASEALGKNQPLQPADGVEGTSSPRAPSLPGASSGTGQHSGTGSSLPPGSKLTPLAIQVLGDLAAAPVVGQLLAVEPHMMRDKLQKMRVVLMHHPDTHADIKAFSAKVNALPDPKPHMPDWNYESEYSPQPAVTSSTPTALSAALDTKPTPTSASAHYQHPRLASPAHFTPPPVSDVGPRPYPATTTSPGGFGDGLEPLFGSRDDANMFASPANNRNLNPSFGAAKDDVMFGSPASGSKTGGVGGGGGGSGFLGFASSAGSGSGSGGGVGIGGVSGVGVGGVDDRDRGMDDNMFADMVHDHDHEHEHEQDQALESQTIGGGFDGAADDKSLPSVSQGMVSTAPDASSGSMTAGLAPMPTDTATVFSAEGATGLGQAADNKELALTAAAGHPGNNTDDAMDIDIPSRDNAVPPPAADAVAQSVETAATDVESGARGGEADA